MASENWKSARARFISASTGMTCSALSAATLRMPRTGFFAGIEHLFGFGDHQGKAARHLKHLFALGRQPDLAAGPGDELAARDGLECLDLGGERRLADTGKTGGGDEAASRGDAVEGEDVGQVHRSVA